MNGRIFSLSAPSATTQSATTIIEAALIKPDQEDPEEFFWLHPDTAHIEPAPDLPSAEATRAEETISLLDLQRPALVASRSAKLEEINAWWRGFERTGAFDSRHWLELSKPGAEYKLVLRWFLRSKGVTALAEEDRRRFHDTAGTPA